jgi:hypothetical protein
MFMQINPAVEYFKIKISVEYFKIKISVANFISYKTISASQFSLSMTFFLARNGSERSRSADEYTGAEDCRSGGRYNCCRHCRRHCHRHCRRLCCRH